MRLIDADTIEYTHAIARCIDDGHNWNELCVTKDEIDDMPTIEPETEEEAYERGYTAGQMAERKNGKWIPVSEKAHPPKEGKYLVTDDAGGMATVDIDDFIYCYDGIGRWLYSQNVTAWMPYELPEPYREEGDYA